MRSLIILSTLMMVFLSGVYAQKIDHSKYNTLLASDVSNTGVVNYSSLKQKKQQLDAVIKEYESIKADKYAKNEQLAFYINYYNAATLKLIVDHWPIKSITALDKGKTWDVKRVKIGAKLFSLNEIENTLIRPVFKDARIHFGLNCGATSCPPLFNKAFTGDLVQSQLETRTKAFINDKKYNTFGSGTVNISKIFEWYKDDFGNVMSYLKKYNPNTPNTAKIVYNDYDWSINGK